MLGLSSNRIGDVGTQDFFNGLVRNSYLKYLSYGDNPISDEIVVKISGLLLKNFSLEILDLYGVEFSDVGAK